MADSLEVGHRVEALAAEMLDLKRQIANLTAVLSKFITEKNTDGRSWISPTRRRGGAIRGAAGLRGGSGKESPRAGSH
jgi:hypothetical protein